MTDTAAIRDEVFEQVRLRRANDRGSVEPGWSERELQQALRVVHRLTPRGRCSTTMQLGLGARAGWRGASLQEELSLALRRGDVTFLVRDLPAGRPATPDQPRPPGSVRPPAAHLSKNT